MEIDQDDLVHWSSGTARQEVDMSWVILFFAGLLETVWAVGLKISATAPKPWLTFMIVVALIGSMWLLTLAMKQIPLGTAYAVWTGIGTLGAFLFGALYLQEPISLGKLISVALLLCGLIGLRLTSN